MSHVSPYSRAKIERGKQYLTTSLFVGGSAALFALAWLIDWSLFFSPPNPPPKPTPIIHGTEVDWSARIDAIEQELPASNNVESIQLRQRLQRVDQILNGGKLSTDAEATIQLALNELQQHAAMFKAQSNRPAVNAEGLAEELSSTAQSILMAEQEAMRQAREQAQRKVRENKEPVIRDVRLAVRDNQDKATDLQRQIAQMQQEQSEFKAKAARAEALRRDKADVDRYLQPFTAPGYLQPKSDKNAWDTERTADAKPVSLARLKRLGALEDTMEGLERLYIFGGGKNPALNNSRPLGSFPQYWAQHLNKPEVRNVVKRAQQLLRDHGQALVEEQLLSP